ncbi:hypothetical protein MELB17_02415 [Marinobacter sp. ELB17]|nr:hypothetical protein MELB17_02415 [Marinobacter sp. ELB17]
MPRVPVRRNMASSSASDKHPEPWASKRSRGRSSVGHNAANGAAAALANGAAEALSAIAEVALDVGARVVSVEGLTELGVAWGFLMIASLQMKGRLIRAA